MATQTEIKRTNAGVKVGDVFHGAHGWGGSVTHDFYVVDELNGRTQVVLKRFEPEHPEPTSVDRAKMGPYDSLVCAGDMSRDLSLFETIRRAVWTQSGVDVDGNPTQHSFVKINEYERAYKLNAADLRRTFTDRY